MLRQELELAKGVLGDGLRAGFIDFGTFADELLELRAMVHTFLLYLTFLQLVKEVCVLDLFHGDTLGL